MKNEICKILENIPVCQKWMPIQTDRQECLSYFVATIRAVMYHPSLLYILSSPEIHQ